jgi:Rps23 Pro-64 3,4-dihydroxylase Tpa1-like proline 4-hydroxylase
MNVIHSEDGLLVVDEVLPQAGFRALCRDTARGDFRHTHSQKWDKAWRVWDGHPLRGDSVYFDPTNHFGRKDDVSAAAKVMDPLIEAVRKMAVATPQIAGVEGRDWVALYFCPWLYPVGSSLSQHRDAGRYSGSFTYFIHSRWGTHWGGDLVVSQPLHGSTSAASVDPEAYRSWDETWACEDEEEQTDVSGVATCVSPSPNRLVLIGASRPHRIVRVDQNAGARARASIAGFFLRPP